MVASSMSVVAMNMQVNATSNAKVRNIERQKRAKVFFKFSMLVFQTFYNLFEQ